MLGMHRSLYIYIAEAICKVNHKELKLKKPLRFKVPLWWVFIMGICLQGESRGWSDICLCYDFNERSVIRERLM